LAVKYPNYSQMNLHDKFSNQFFILFFGNRTPLGNSAMIYKL
jgi:hypothetical protein